MNPSLVAARDRPQMLAALDDMFTPHALETLLELKGPVPTRLWRECLHGPLAGFLARPGKELRARLVQWGWSLGGGDGEAPPVLAISVEALHAGSLIVDDIEDGSQERRGEPALHVRHGVPRALNAGTWLYFWPHALLADLDVTPAIRAELGRMIGVTLLRAHYGQALDVSVDVSTLPQRDIEPAVHAATQLKTGALVELAIGMGATVAGASAEVVRHVSLFGRHFGMALQMLDDVSGLAARRAKGEEDLRLGRLTWPWAWLAAELDDNEFGALQSDAKRVRSGALTPSTLADALAARIGPSGRARVHHVLRRSLVELSAHLGTPPALKDLEKEIDTLERSYG